MQNRQGSERGSFGSVIVGLTGHDYALSGNVTTAATMEIIGEVLALRWHVSAASIPSC
jgi:hypothetical protein